MTDILIVAVAVAIMSFLAFSPRLRRSSRWAATTIPLASIMGSGFLVSAPLLAGIVGTYALVSMGALLGVAYLIGSLLRYNIRYFEPIQYQARGSAHAFDTTSELVLAFAYFISVSYYLQLLGAFLLSLGGIHDNAETHAITTLLLILIGTIGVVRGLGFLERIETKAIALNLGMITALILVLAYYNAHLAAGGEWHLPHLHPTIDLDAVRVVLGLLIIVQGFETSRYLGDKHDPEERILTMRRAQLISSAVYVVFIALVSVLFHRGLASDVTAITSMVAPIALILPLVITIAAVGSQFSAAVADYSGAGGLIEQLTHRKVTLKHAYVLIFLVSLALTWASNVNEIIAYASRAFALYYFLQMCVSIVVSHHRNERAVLARGVIAAVLSLAVFLFGLPAEGGA